MMSDKHTLGIDEIMNDLLDLIEKNFAIDKSNISDDTSIDDLSIDKFSTDFVDLLMLIETRFDVNIDNDEFINVDKISDLINLIKTAYEIKKKSSNKSKVK